MAEKDDKAKVPKPIASLEKTDRDSGPGRPPGTDARKTPHGERR